MEGMFSLSRYAPRNEPISGSINNHLQTARLVILKPKVPCFFLLFLSKLHQHRPHSFKELCRMFLWVFVFVCVPHPLPWLRAQHCYLHHPWRARVLPDGKMWSTNQPKAKLEICAQPDVQAKPRSSQKSPCIVRNLF